MKGALPPSSRDILESAWPDVTHFLRVLEHMAASCLPTPVLPVNDTFLMMGLVQSTLATMRESREVMTLRTPLGTPAWFASSIRARADKGVSLGALTTHVQPAARAGPILRVIMAEGTGVSFDRGWPTVPRRDDADNADRLLDDDVAQTVNGRGDHVAISAHSLGSKPGVSLATACLPFDEGRRVGLLSARIGQRFAYGQNEPSCRTILKGLASAGS